jgi:NAD(P)-dependent dehydrogenase (short-subunit alcohol dehydrogenase family)
VSDEAQRPRTALVAGGSGALGSAVTLALLERGDRVCVPWFDEREADQLRDDHPDAVRDGRLRLSQCDVTELDQVAALLDVLRADWGPLWLACSLVGGWAGGTNLDEVHDLSLLDRMVRLNLRSAAAVAAEGLRHMGPAGGRVILVGSKTALVPAAGQAAYSAAKAGVLSLAATLAREVAGTGRTANAIVPDIIDTPANRQSMPEADYERWLPPRAVADVVAWLGSGQSAAVNGAAIPLTFQ